MKVKPGNISSIDKQFLQSKENLSGKITSEKHKINKKNNIRKYKRYVWSI